MTPPPNTPCARCGTLGGIVPNDQKRPARRQGKAVGVDGWLCLTCYRVLRSRQSAPPKVQQKTPSPTEDEIKAAAKVIFEEHLERKRRETTTPTPPAYHAARHKYYRPRRPLCLS